MIKIVDNKVVTVVEDVPVRAARKRRFGGQGGHMDAALLHKIRFYDKQIIALKDAARQSRTKKEATEYNRRAESMVQNRKRFVRQIKERLQERGYVYTA